jgi:hypothetical protein
MAAAGGDRHASRATRLNTFSTATYIKKRPSLDGVVVARTRERERRQRTPPQHFRVDAQIAIDVPDRRPLSSASCHRSSISSGYFLGLDTRGDLLSRDNILAQRSRQPFSLKSARDAYRRGRCAFNEIPIAMSSTAPPKPGHCAVPAKPGPAQGPVRLVRVPGSQGHDRNRL